MERGNSKHEAAPPPIFFQSSAEADSSCHLPWVLGTLELSTLSWQDVVVLGYAPYLVGQEERHPLFADAFTLLTLRKMTDL